MKFDFKRIENSRSEVSDFVSYLKTIGKGSLWVYQGLIVEIDPTVDFNDENVLIRWTDIQEGFNDKTIYYTLAKFKKDFKLYDA